MSRAPKPTRATPTITVEPIMADRDTAARLLGISITTFERHVRAGLLPKPRELGGSARWLVTELRNTANALPISTLLPPPSAAAEQAA